MSKTRSDKVVGSCANCGRKFTQKDYDDASKGVQGCLVGDYDNVCYPCQFKMMDNGTWDDFKSASNK